jgi:hypothetical protein
LLLFEKAKVRFTFNDQTPARRFTQGQVAMVTGFTERTDGVRGVRLKVARPGAQNVTAADGSSAEIEIFPTWSNSTVSGKVGFQQARRKQLCLVPHGFSTIHKSIGQTCEGVATRLSVTDPSFKLWTREQLLVIISRVTTLKNLMFIGPKDDNLKAIKQALRRVPRRWKEIANMVQYTDVVSNGRYQTVQLFANAPTLINPRALPDDNLGYLYVLMSSKKDSSFGYVGETNCLQRRLREHNNLFGGCVQTNNPDLMPYIVMGYVFGFPGSGDDRANREMRKALERKVEQRLKSLQRQERRIVKDFELREMAEEETLQMNAETGSQLTFVRCVA